MNTAPAILRSRLFKDSSSVCFRCLKRLSRPGPQVQRRSLNFSSTVRSAAVQARQARNVWSKDYFWANRILEDVVARSKRGLRSTATAGNEAVVESARLAALRDAETISKAGSDTTGSSIPQQELPHRRRKRLREEAEAAAYPIAPDASSRLTTVSSSLPAHSLRRRFTTYLSLSKPRLTFLIVLATTSAYGMFPVPALLAPTATATPSLSTLTLLFLTTGTALSSASANALNMLIEPAHDAKMSRTKNRPLVRGLISKRGAFLFALLTGVTGVGSLYFGVNPTVAFLGGLNIFLYAGVYTPLKRMHVINTWVGAVVGGIPPLMGWAAAAGQTATNGGTWQELLFGEQSMGGWLLAGLLYCWQFPHFNALSWSIREEYKYAGYRMLAWVNPAMNGRVALRYSFLMFPVCIGLSYVGVTDWSFILTSSIPNGWMLYNSIKFWRQEGAKGSARGLFWASVWHLPLVLVLAMVQKKGLGERVWNSIKELAGVGMVDEDDEDDEDDYEDDDGLPLSQGNSTSLVKASSGAV